MDPKHLRYTGWTAADQRATGYLVRGEFEQLSNAALDRLDGENVKGGRRVDALLHELRDREDEVRESLVAPRRDADLSVDARTFVSRWNGFLTSTADSLRDLRQTMRQMKPMLADMIRLASAARAAKVAGTTSEFVTVRRLTMRDLVQRQERLQRELHAITRQTPAERQFGEFVDASHEAQTIVKEVSRRFPHGFFAQLTGEGK
jgi:hypothetical protein